MVARLTTLRLPYGIRCPMIPESSEIMNIVVPGMLQNALTGKMSVSDAADDAAGKVRELLSL